MTARCWCTWSSIFTTSSWPCEKPIRQRPGSTTCCRPSCAPTARRWGPTPPASRRPDIEGIFAVKAGSSLYAGKGSDEDGDFIVVSSDLTSVLAKTRFLIPLVEGQGIYFSAGEYFVFSLADGSRSVPGLKRSKLNIADIALQPKYHFFMEQEIDSTVANLDTILKYYFSQHWEEPYFSVFERHVRDCKDIVFDLLKLYSMFDREQLKRAFLRLVGHPRFEAIVREIDHRRAAGRPAVVPAFFTSDEAQLLRELREFGEEYYPALLTLDLIIIWKKKRKVIRFKDKAVALFQQSFAAGGRVFFIGSGTSYHAALTAGYFFNNLTALAIVPCNPDLFRSVYMNSLRPGDVLVAITQSGETKDLVDILNQVREKFREKVHVIAVVNNENSTIPQEKADFFLPLLCGPEIAVAATKSFNAQLALFYLLAAGMKKGALPQPQLEKIRNLIDYTLKTCDEEVTEVMLKFFLKPSIHILGTSLNGLAREGALKIREVVLNHAEGYDAAEFKHGPNTILGKNTLYSFLDMEKLMADMADFSRDLLRDAVLPAGKREEIGGRFFNWIRDFKFADFSAEIASSQGAGPGKKDRFQELYRRFRAQVNAERYFSNYPLVFVCPPDERDIRITISQIHTHKIRGADVVLIAEENEELKKALEGKPAGMDDYFCKYIRVPASGDSKSVRLPGGRGAAAAGPENVGGQDEIPQPRPHREPRRPPRRAQERLQVHHRGLSSRGRNGGPPPQFRGIDRDRVQQRALGHLVDDDPRLFLLDHANVEVQPPVPDVDDAPEVLRQVRVQLLGERVADHHGGWDLAAGGLAGLHAHPGGPGLEARGRGRRAGAERDLGLDRDAHLAEAVALQGEHDRQIAAGRGGLADNEAVQGHGPHPGERFAQAPDHLPVGEKAAQVVPVGVGLVVDPGVALFAKQGRAQVEEAQAGMKGEVLDELVHA